MWVFFFLMNVNMRLKRIRISVKLLCNLCMNFSLHSVLVWRKTAALCAMISRPFKPLCSPY